MNFKIKPQKGCMVEKERFTKGNKELLIGIVWQGGSVYTHSKPTFIHDYDPEIGMLIFNIKEYVGHETIDGEVHIFFSETITDDEQDFLNGIINESTYHEVLRGFGWKQDKNTDIVIWGDLIINKNNS